MSGLPKYSFLNLLLISFIPFLANGQNLLQTHNLALLRQLNISGNPYPSYLSNELPPEIKTRWLSKAVIPPQVEGFLGVILQEYEAKGALDDLIDPVLFEGVDNEDCKGHVLEWIHRFIDNGTRWITEKDKWAAQMVDAWGKIPEGILTGHISSYGDFDECVQVKASNIDVLNDKYKDISTSFEGSYCTSYILDYGSAMAVAGRVPQVGESTQNKIDPEMESQEKNGTDSIGVQKALSVEEFLNKLLLQKISMIMMLPSTATCMPSSCSMIDVQNILVNGLNMVYSEVAKYGENVNITQLPWPVTINCSVGKKQDLDAPAIIVIVLLALLLVVSVGAGVVDYWLNHGDKNEKEKPIERGTGYKYLMAFSFYSNTKKWLSTRKSADDLGCLHGIRFFSTAWVVLAHTYFVFMSAPQWNLLDFKTMWKDWTVLAVINGTYSVDTFFVMSGMLATYNILKLLDRTKGKFNVPMFYIHRIVRLTPTYAILVGLASTVTVYLGSGPLWFTVENSEKICRKNWWINLLYINNIYKSDESCNGESWYLANDMQFYFLSPLIVYPIWKWRKIGLPLLSLYTVLSCISPALVSHYQDTPPAMIVSIEGDQLANMTKIYFRPWTRIQTFLVGVWLGWILHVTRGKRVKLPVWAVAAGWLTSTALVLTILFGVTPWFNPANEVPKAAGLFYAGLSRFTYGVGLSWVIFACIKGYGGIVNSFLSWKVFMPLGRLCFCVYLISLHLQHTFHVGLKVPMKYDTYSMVNMFFAHMVSSYLAGFVATMLFESPFIVLQKLIFEGK